MPSTTERQQIMETLHKALLFNLIIEAEQDMESSDSSSGTSDDDGVRGRGGPVSSGRSSTFYRYFVHKSLL